jgi:exopolysaccharide production protein ExoQ
MPPPLALLLCTVFVAFLLRLDRKQELHVSHALWIPTIWLCYIGSKPLGIWFGSQGDTESGSVLDRTFQIALFAIGWVILAHRGFDWGGALKSQPWLLVLVSYMLISVVWSDFPFIAFKRWTKEIVAITMALVVLSEREPRRAFQTILRRSAYVLIPFSLMLIKYYPKFGVDFAHSSGERMWVGVTQQKNALGRLCLISAFWLIWTLFRRWRGRGLPPVKYQTVAEVFILLITFWLLRGPGGAYSATAIGALMLGLAIFAGLLWMKKRRKYVRRGTLVAVTAGIILFGFLTPLLQGSTMGVISSWFGRNTTLTGRTEIWAELVPVALKHPVLGTGFGSFWTSQTIEEHKEKECHNGYLEVFLTLGFIGLVLVSMFLTSIARNSQRALMYDYDWGILCICMLIMTLAHNITESSIDSFSRQLMAVVLFLSFSTATAGIAEDEDGIAVEEGDTLAPEDNAAVSYY